MTVETMRALVFLLLCCLSSAVPQTTQGNSGQAQLSGVGNEQIQIVALGRPFSLGMFYDSRRDTLVPGLTLWDKDKLDKDTTETPQPNTEFNIVASESISDKASSLGVEASLKASFLSGLISVEGSAKYLKDDKKSNKQARVTLQYKTTTVFKALSMDQLGTENLKHSAVIELGLATHVVTGILYGAQAFFVFSQESSDDVSVQDIHGSLKVMVKKIPSIEIEGSGALSMNDTDREQVKKFSCTFHGDFLLKSSPTTFEEAVRIYQTLPELLGPNKENAVPMVVYLLPLSTLDSQASKLVRQISIRSVTKVENMLEGFTELEMLSNDLLKSSAAQKFPQIFNNIKTFKHLCSEFKLGLQRTLAQKLPLIRGGGEGEEALAVVLRVAAESPFNINRLNQWIVDKTDQAETIKTIMKRINTIEIVSSENALIDKVIDAEKTLVFQFTFLSRGNSFLSELEEYLKDPQSHRSNSAMPRRWYKSRDVVNSVILKAKLFSDFAEANKNRDKKSIQFMALGMTDENHEGSTVHLYEDGSRVNVNFDLPSKPRAVTVVKVSHSFVILTFTVPSSGAQNITEYRVEFCEKGLEEWNHKLQPQDGMVTLSGLTPNTEYRFRVRATTAVGVGPEAVPNIFIRTLPCGPPEDLRGTASFTKISVRWRKPSQVGQDVHILSYIVEFGQSQENIQWSREESQSEEKVISGLQPETNYSIRVLCNCGEHGMSSQSSIITVTTMNCTTAKDSEQDSHTLLKDLRAELALLQNKVKRLEMLNKVNLLLSSCNEENVPIEGGTYTFLNGLKQGSILKYHCDEGFYPYPDPFRLCQDDDTWEPAPKRSTCRQVECPDPTVMENGSVFPTQQRYVYQNQITYKCHEGHKLDGPSERMCLSSGKWSGRHPVCHRESEDHCLDLGVPPGASRTGSLFDIGEKVTYSCNDSMILIGSEERVCQEDGLWSGVEPSCYYPYTYDTPLEVAQELCIKILHIMTFLQFETEIFQTERVIRLNKNRFLNVYIAVDVSMSVGSEFFRAKEAAVSLIEKIAVFSVSPELNVIFFSSLSSEVVSVLPNTDSLLKHVNSLMEHTFGANNQTGDDLFTTILRQIKRIKHREQANFEKHYHFIVIFTDGKYNIRRNSTGIIEQIKSTVLGNDPKREDHLDIYALATGTTIDDGNIQSLTFGTGGKHYFRLESFDKLHEAFDETVGEEVIRGLCGLHIDTNGQDEDMDDETKRKKYPWVVSVSVVDNGKTSECLGSLVSPHFVLTSAQCITVDTVVDNNIQVEVSNGRGQLDVKNVYKHPQFNISAKADQGVEQFYDYDVALVELRGHVHVSDSLRPICLPCTAETNGAMKQNLDCKQQERLLLKNQQKIHFLRSKSLNGKEARLKLGKSREKCLRRALDARGITTTNVSAVVTENFLCSGGTQPDHVACKGDSGGAVFKNHRERTIQVAVVTGGNRLMECETDEDSGNFYLNLFKVLPFLKSILGKTGQHYAPLDFVD